MGGLETTGNDITTPKNSQGLNPRDAGSAQALKCFRGQHSEQLGSFIGKVGKLRSSSQ